MATPNCGGSPAGHYVPFHGAAFVVYPPGETSDRLREFRRIPVGCVRTPTQSREDAAASSLTSDF